MANSMLLCLVVSWIIHLAHFETALVIQETRKVKVCSSSGSYTLSKSNVTTIHVSLILDSNKRTNLFIWRDSIGCFVNTETLADGTRIRCTSDGKLIVDQAAEGSPTGTFARYLFEGRLSNGSDFLQIYEVEFIEWVMLAKGVESLETTSLTTCVTQAGAISLHGNDPSRLVEKLWWRAKYQNGPWVDIGHCVNTKGCTKSPTSSLLPSDTRVWIERNGSLIVERTSNQRNATAQFQFLFEDSLKRRRIFKVHFTLYCTWTRPGANLNLSQAVEELFSKKYFVEVYLFDANETQFAIIHSNKGASLSLKYESHSPTAAYWNRLRIERGSLIFPKINEADNGTTIILRALLNSEQTRLGALSTKTMRIFVCNLSANWSPAFGFGPSIIALLHLRA